MDKEIENVLEHLRRPPVPPPGKGATIVWGQTGAYSAYDPITNEITVSRKHIAEGHAPAVLAHEMAHRREGIYTGRRDTWGSEKDFWKEIATWEAAIKKGLSPNELDNNLIDDSLGSYLDAIENEYGQDSSQYKTAKFAYLAFKRKYGLTVGDVDSYDQRYLTL